MLLIGDYFIEKLLTKFHKFLRDIISRDNNSKLVDIAFAKMYDRSCNFRCFNTGEMWLNAIANKNRAMGRLWMKRANSLIHPCRFTTP